MTPCMPSEVRTNAQVELTSPGMIGAHVCHLHSHTTFSIPARRQRARICVRNNLTPFLPDHSVVSPSTGGSLGAVWAAPWRQAGIAVIPSMYGKMLGAEGLKDSKLCAILNASYTKARLERTFNVCAMNKNAKSPHEFIIACSSLAKKSGVTEEDIAKRLQDNGFHAPTMSWLVPHTLMAEPTEPENKGELNSFVDARLGKRFGRWGPADSVFALTSLSSSLILVHIFGGGSMVMPCGQPHDPVRLSTGTVSPCGTPRQPSWNFACFVEEASWFDD